MMIPEEYEAMMLLYLSSLVEGPGFRTVGDLHRLSSRELLGLARKVDDSALSLFVQLLKRSQGGESLFEKLMGEHEEENRALVDSFFERYMKMVLAAAEEVRDFNPLLAYLPPETFEDLAFVQSRQAFFLRQTADTINDYLRKTLRCPRAFVPGEQEEAWKWFWAKLLDA